MSASGDQQRRSCRLEGLDDIWVDHIDGWYCCLCKILQFEIQRLEKELIADDGRENRKEEGLDESRSSFDQSIEGKVPPFSSCKQELCWSMSR